MIQSAKDILQQSIIVMSNRAVERDTEQERSMASCVSSFNAMFGKDLTEEQGWHFMCLLKMSRSKGGNIREDDYIDQAAYAALAGECALVARSIPEQGGEFDG